MFLLDTNIISELIKKQPNPYVLERMEESRIPPFIRRVYAQWNSDLVHSE